MKAEFGNYRELFETLLENSNVVGIEGSARNGVSNKFVEYFQTNTDKQVLRISGEDTDGVVMVVSAMSRWLDYESMGFGMFETVLFIDNAEKLHDMSVLILKELLPKMDDENYVIVLSGEKDSDWKGFKELIGENILRVEARK